MYRKIITVCILWCLSNSVFAHEWTPTYPKLRPSFVDGISVTDMTLFNNRKDVQYYKVSVFDAEWNTVPFSTGSDKIIKVSHLQRKKVSVYIRDKDADRVTYVCSRSKSLLDGQRETFVASRICSKIK